MSSARVTLKPLLEKEDSDPVRRELISNQNKAARAPAPLHLTRASMPEVRPQTRQLGLLNLSDLPMPKCPRYSPSW